MGLGEGAFWCYFGADLLVGPDLLFVELCFHLGQCLFVVAILFFHFYPVLLFQLAIDSMSARNLLG